jgi:hypothetical protein
VDLHEQNMDIRKRAYLFRAHHAIISWPLYINQFSEMPADGPDCASPSAYALNHMNRLACEVEMLCHCDLISFALAHSVSQSLLTNSFALLADQSHS